jgi:hypothetical protein
MQNASNFYRICTCLVSIANITRLIFFSTFIGNYIFTPLAWKKSAWGFGRNFFIFYLCGKGNFAKCNELFKNEKVRAGLRGTCGTLVKGELLNYPFCLGLAKPLKGSEYINPVLSINLLLTLVFARVIFL